MAWPSGVTSSHPAPSFPSSHLTLSVCLKNPFYSSNLSGFVCLRKSLFQVLKGYFCWVQNSWLTPPTPALQHFKDCHLNVFQLSQFRKKSALVLLCSSPCYVGFICGFFFFFLAALRIFSIDFDFYTVNLVILGMRVDYIFISHGCTPRNGIARLCGNCVCNILRKCQAVLQAVEPFLILSATHEPSTFSTSLPALIITVLLKWHLIVLLSN